MKLVTPQPVAFDRFESIGGVLRFRLFEAASVGEDEVVSAITSTLPAGSSFDAEALLELGGHRTDEQVFFGNRYDAASGSLIAVGEHRTADGRQLVDPALALLDEVVIESSVSALPEPGWGGHFALAFSSPPYGLKASPREVQALFDEVKAVILPPQHEAEIIDWTNPRLPQVSSYFAAGMEWWGVYLFSIYVPATRQLTIIAGSASD
jgi:hypothetical protein